MNDQQKELGQYWTEFLQKEYKNETDRGAVVLTASLLENALTNILKKFLVASSASQDELFDLPNAPISTFSAKIKLCERLGLISTRLSRDLNLVRKIRNEFAHNIHGSSLESGKIKDLLTNLTTSSAIVAGHKELTNFGTGARGDFLKFSNIVLFHIHTMTEMPDDVKSLGSRPDEWLYDWVFEKENEESPVNTSESLTVENKII